MQGFHGKPRGLFGEGIERMKEAAKHAEYIMSDNARASALLLTKLHLEGFRAQVQYVKNLEEDIEDRYETSEKMVATYGEHIGHSSVEPLHSGARLADNVEHQEQRREHTKAKHLLERLTRAIEDLPNAERVILQERYINPVKEPWSHIAEVIGYEERWCYMLHNRGLRNTAIHLFGLSEVLKAEKDKRDKRNRA